MESFRSRAELWIRDQRQKLMVQWSPSILRQPQWRWSPPMLRPPQWRWPPWKSGDDNEEEKRRIKEELQRRRKRLKDLCREVKAETVSDLQDILCSMILSECVYKRPTTEMLRVINKFVADFGGHVSLERVQPSLDHVPHRYLLAEAGNTLYASFIGTKQYKDVMADANILQGVLFHDDDEDDEDCDVTEVTTSDTFDCESQINGRIRKPIQPRPPSPRKKSKPAAHRGFLTRAKGIPALELYKLAQKKNRKLVLCGHSLGGAVAALATLAILRGIASSSSKEHDKVPVKCITFSQPPVGNAALRDYVHRKGWHHFFKTYCIPEDLIPRILSPAYFDHYNAQPLQASTGPKLKDLPSDDQQSIIQTPTRSKSNDREHLVMGLGPVQTSFWRLSKLVPIVSVQKQLNKFTGRRQESKGSTSSADAGLISKPDQMDPGPQSLEIQENSDGISLAPINTENSEAKVSQQEGKHLTMSVDSGKRRTVPYLPSYVPFGELYLLGNLSVDFLSNAEYSKLTSVRSVLTELRGRLQSHSMKSYRARFQKIYDMFMGVEQGLQFSQLQQWLGFETASAVELGNIVEAPAIQVATSIVPLNWSGLNHEKNTEPFKVDIMGYGLHLCTLIQAQVNGNWCSTSVESLPSAPPYCSNQDASPHMQKMRILVGAPLRQPPRHAIVADSVGSIFPPDDIGSNEDYGKSSNNGQPTCNESLNNLVIFCASDFTTVSKEVYVRKRRVRLLGLEGAGKTSLFTAILGKCKGTKSFSFEIMNPFMDAQEGTIGGLCYSDPGGINLQDLHLEVNRFREELLSGVHDFSRKIDLIVLVHNLSHKVPRYHQPNSSLVQPALSPLLNEAKLLGIPWVLAITNKYSVSAHQQRSLVCSIIDAYQAPPSMTQVINSCPYVIPSASTSFEPSDPAQNGDSSRRMAAQSLVLAPINFVRMPFRKNASVMPVDGVNSLCKLVHGILRSQEEASFEELAQERLAQEMAKKSVSVTDGRVGLQGKGNSAEAAAVGASIGAGVGLLLALVMGAASALRKP